jgi:hypothetical protein
MKHPGFSAEASLYMKSIRYQQQELAELQRSADRVVPAETVIWQYEDT